MRAAITLAALLALGASAASAQEALRPQVPPGSTQARGSFVDAQGRQVGTAHLVQTPNGVLVTVEVRGVEPGVHGFHIHEAGRCEHAGGFQSAGGHYNPDGKEHGFLVEGGPHAGDMPNQHVGADGVLRAQVVNDRVNLERGQGALFDSDGSALVVHAKADDHRSQPSGDAGGRVACAVIERAG